jgi:alpha-L-fucosidase
MTINGTWAYNRNDREFKSPAQLIRMLVEVASKGGNFLLDVGPGPDGTIQPEFQERLLAIGKWLEVNGEAIYGTTYGPLYDLPFGRSTGKAGTIYVHVFDWPVDGELQLHGLPRKVTAARLLAGRTPLLFRQNGDRLSLHVPRQPPDPYVSVLAIDTGER